MSDMSVITDTIKISKHIHHPQTWYWCIIWRNCWAPFLKNHNRQTYETDSEVLPPLEGDNKSEWAFEAPVWGLRGPLWWVVPSDHLPLYSTSPAVPCLASMHHWTPQNSLQLLKTGKSHIITPITNVSIQCISSYLYLCWRKFLKIYHNLTVKSIELYAKATL